MGHWWDQGPSEDCPLPPLGHSAYCTATVSTLALPQQKNENNEKNCLKKNPVRTDRRFPTNKYTIQSITFLLSTFTSSLLFFCFSMPWRNFLFHLSTHTDTNRLVVLISTAEFVSSVKLSELRPGCRTTRPGWHRQRRQSRSREVLQAIMAQVGLLEGTGELGGTSRAGFFSFSFLPLNWA